MSLGTLTELAPAEPAASLPRRAWRLATRLVALSGNPLLRKSGLAVIEQGLVSGTSFATSVLLARYASRQELGVYYLALSIVFFARGIQEQLVSAPYMIYCGRKSGAALAEYAGSALLHQCAVMLATSLVLAAALALGLAPPAAAAALWLLVLAAPLLLMREFARQMSFAHLQLGLAIALNLAIGVFQLGAIALLAATGCLSVLAALAVMAVASGLASAAWVAIKPQACAGRLRAALRDLGANWPFARWALASQLLASTAPYALPWVVALTHGESETGLLGACSTLVGLSNTFLMGLCNYLSPRAARAYAEGGLAALQDVLRQTALLFVATLGTAAVAAALFGEQAAILVYGPKFLGAGPIIAVLSLGVLANSVGVTAGNGLWAMERPSANFTADLCSLVVVLVATALLVPQFGPLGAAWATLLGTAAGAAVRVLALRSAMREHALDCPSREGSRA